jgi:hypothetical protein
MKNCRGGTVSVATILAECRTSLIADWLARTKKTPELNHLRRSDEERTGHLPKLVEDLIEHLGRPKLPDKDGDAVASPAAIEHGKLRRTQGYSSGTLIHESRILQVDHVWEIAHAPDRSGFQRAVARCRDHRGRSGCPVDPNDVWMYAFSAFSKGKTKIGGSLKVVNG